jgi:hypothetical protein
MSTATITATRPDWLAKISAVHPWAQGDLFLQLPDMTDCWVHHPPKLLELGAPYGLGDLEALAILAPAVRHGWVTVVNGNTVPAIAPTGHWSRDRGPIQCSCPHLRRPGDRY